MKKLLMSLMIVLLSHGVDKGWADGPLPTFKKNSTDFFYAQQTSLWIFYKVPREIIMGQVGETLDALGLELATFEDPRQGYMIIKPMVFMAEFGEQSASTKGTSASTEVEFTVLVHPKNKVPPQKTFEDFLLGKTKNTSVGQLRLDVLCDEEVAVAAGRKLFGEHKFLGSFAYSYPTPNSNLGSAPAFSLALTASTWKGAGLSQRKMFSLKADLRGLRGASSQFSPELLFSAFPPEPQAGVLQKAVGEFRYYNNENFQAFMASPSSRVELSFGKAEGATQLSPVAPFGNNQPIPGSERWPGEMVERMRKTVAAGSVVGYLLFRSPPAEYETKPFELNN